MRDIRDALDGATLVLDGGNPDEWQLDDCDTGIPCDCDIRSALVTHDNAHEARGLGLGAWRSMRYLTDTFRYCLKIAPDVRKGRFRSIKPPTQKVLWEKHFEYVGLRRELATTSSADSAETRNKKRQRDRLRDDLRQDLAWTYEIEITNGWKSLPNSKGKKDQECEFNPSRIVMLKNIVDKWLRDKK